MRADAQRNRERIVATAREVFREQGYDASLDEIAKRAGIGAGTLYRHFPRRDALLDAVMQPWVDRVQEAVEKSLVVDESPRALLLAWLTTYVELITQHRGAATRLTAALGDPEAPIRTKCEVLVRATDQVLARVAEEGALREGVDALQVCRLAGGVASVADSGDLEPAAIAPLVEVVADGLLT